jgi:hypothetical protein
VQLLPTELVAAFEAARRMMGGPRKRGRFLPDPDLGTLLAAIGLFTLMALALAAYFEWWD